ncbi:hypothetical protein GF359_03685 [candidate division WOR-3 bacterium]|uniref:Uncharacterized protein n=1 Tax=candidate division WOR-3 bacterium TaxID=2052148 RepID=A0A9D5K8I5_UNCW3|nr:hypothetical protein [candidate division WOR-3 bacterium]MBD3364297.1 hypothetical protein [candidate division WOR-3 bacterium]
MLETIRIIRYSTAASASAAGDSFVVRNTDNVPVSGNLGRAGGVVEVIRIEVVSGIPGSVEENTIDDVVAAPCAIAFLETGLPGILAT